MTASTSMTHSTPPPRWHTALLVAMIVAVAVAGTLLTAHRLPTQIVSESRAVSAYIPALMMQWGLFGYVAIVGRPRGEWRHLLGVETFTRGRIWGDAVAALVCVALIAAMHRVATVHLGVGRAASMRAILPHSPLQHVEWILVVVSAGICEEVVFRGYLLNQFTRIARNAFIGVALQAVLFGVAHLEQGPTHATLIAIDGALLGTCAVARGGLRACFIAHIAINLLSA